MLMREATDSAESLTSRSPVPHSLAVELSVALRAAESNTSTWLRGTVSFATSHTLFATSSATFMARSGSSAVTSMKQKRVVQLVFVEVSFQSGVVMVISSPYSSRI